MVSHPTWPEALFAHTKCACTRATLRELERALAHANARTTSLRTFVLFSGPNDDELLSLRTMAAAIPGVVVMDAGDEVARFGAHTSGQALVYGKDGRLAFRGGLTPSRGHEGASAGGEFVLRAATGAEDRARSNRADEPAQSSDVFGCALLR